MRFADLTLAFLLSNNLLFAHFLGLSELFRGATFQHLFKRSLLLGVLLLSCGGLFWLLDALVLRPFHLAVLTTVAAVFCLALGYYAYSWVRRSVKHNLHWPDPREFLFHSALLGGLLLGGSQAADGFEFLTIAAAGVLGYALGLVLLQNVFQRMGRERIPPVFQGLPFQLFTIGLVWLILSGLDLKLAGTVG